MLSKTHVMSPQNRMLVGNSPTSCESQVPWGFWGIIDYGGLL